MTLLPDPRQGVFFEEPNVMKLDHKYLLGMGSEGRACGGSNEFNVDQGWRSCKSRW